MKFSPVFAAAVLAVCAAIVPSTAPARSHATPTPAPTPTPVADPAVTKLARQQFVAWQSGSIDKSLYVPQVQEKLTDDKIADTSHKLGQLGPLTGLVYIGAMYVTDAPPGSRGYIYQMQCSEGNVYLFLILDRQGKIGSLLFKDRLDTETIEVKGTATPSPAPQ